jgi:hypothetical protein
MKIVMKIVKRAFWILLVAVLLASIVGSSPALADSRLQFKKAEPYEVDGDPEIPDVTIRLPESNQTTDGPRMSAPKTRYSLNAVWPSRGHFDLLMDLLIILGRYGWIRV